MIKEQYMENWAALAVAVIQNIHPNKALKIMGISLREGAISHKWTAKDIAYIEKLRADGLSWSEIADLYGKDRTNVYNAYKYYKQKRM